MPRVRATSLALAAVSAALLATPFTRELFVGDETKYSMVVREMRATHVFFLPTLGGTPFTHKPPLHFWLIDSLSFLFGTYSLATFVIPSLAAFVFLAWLMYRMAGPLAAFVCASSVMIWASSQTARMDVGFTAFIVAALWQMQRFFDEDDFRALTRCGVLLAIATLIKGPMAPVIAIVLFLLEWWRRRRVPRGNYLPALAAMIVIPLLWVVPAVIIGGRHYANEILVKQTVGRAVSSWTHKAGPWFYLAHMPGIAFPWFALGLVAIVKQWRGGDRPRFLINWILAVVVPYSLMSSKLDVYMMAMLPPLAILIADFVRDAAANARDARTGRIANGVTLALLAIAGIVACFISPAKLKGPESALLGDPRVTTTFVILTVASVLALVITWKGSLAASTLATGLAPLAAFVWIGVALMPVVNDLASTTPLIAALEKQHVAGNQIALYQCPHLWSRRNFPRDFEAVQYLDADDFKTHHPQVIATSRAHGDEIASALAGYRKVDELRMIGKWFDVYRR